MARIVYITNGMASTLNSGFEMCRRLVEVGHDVTWLCDQSTAERVKQRDFQVQPLVTDQQIIQQARQANQAYSRRHPWKLLQWLRLRRKLRLDSLANDEIVQKVRELGADLLLIDHEMHFAIIATSCLNIPTLLPSVFFSMYYHPELPPLHKPLVPGNDAENRQAIRKAWSDLFRERHRQHLRERFHADAIRSWFRPVNFQTLRRSDLLAVARQHRYPLPGQTSTKQWAKPHAWMNLPILCYNAQEMELPHLPRSNMHYVGPMIDQQRPDNLMHPDSSELWQRFLYVRTEQLQKSPLVYCALGTYWSTDRRLLNSVVDVFRKRSDWQLVIGLGGKASATDFDNVPKNVLLLDYAPQLEVLAQSDVAITHGGATSVNECVALGVPVLVYSTSHVDQDGNAVRVEFHGLGIRANREQADPTEIESNLEKLMRDATIRDNIARMQQVMEKYRTERTAVNVIQEMLKQGTS